MDPCILKSNAILAIILRQFNSNPWNALSLIFNETSQTIINKSCLEVHQRHFLCIRRYYFKEASSNCRIACCVFRLVFTYAFDGKPTSQYVFPNLEYCFPMWLCLEMCVIVTQWNICAPVQANTIHECHSTKIFAYGPDQHTHALISSGGQAKESTCEWVTSLLPL